MSTGREKDQKDFDLEQIVRVIDQALESDDPRIKDALRALMTITVLCTAEHPDQVMKNGPLARLLDDMRNLNSRLGRLEDELNQVKWSQQKKQVEPFMPTAPSTQPWGPYSTPPTSPWAGTNPNGPKPMWGPTWSSSDDWSNLPDIKKWAAGDDPGYKGSSASTALAEDFLKELSKGAN
jgi:hypothetical protein